MTNKQVIKTWEDLLENYLGCHADAYGNRPCDNGVICDRCMSHGVEKLYQKLVDEALA